MGIGIALIVALGVGVFLLGGSERAEAQSGQLIPGTLTVTGSAAIAAPPDGASIEIGVSSLEATATEALSAGATALELVRAALAEEGVADEDLQTVRIRLDEEHDYTEEGRVSIGFRFSNTIRVTVDGVDGIGDVIDAAVGAGGDAVSIHRIRFLVSNRVALEDTAIDEARRKALAMAGQAGVRASSIGDVIDRPSSAARSRATPCRSTASSGTTQRVALRGTGSRLAAIDHGLARTRPRSPAGQAEVSGPRQRRGGRISRGDRLPRRRSRRPAQRRQQVAGGGRCWRETELEEDRRLRDSRRRPPRRRSRPGATPRGRGSRPRRIGLGLEVVCRGSSPWSTPE